MRILWSASLLGTRFYQHVLVLDPPENELGAAVSDAAEAVAGGRCSGPADLSQGRDVLVN